MATKSTKSTKSTKFTKTPAAKSPPANGALVTGLGETPEQIQDLCADLAAVLLTAIKAKADKDEILEAAYKYGLAERRRRKLMRKVGKSADE